MSINQSFQKSFINKLPVILLNLAIIVGAVYWSSKGTSVSTYDKYTIELKEVVLPVRNLQVSVDFYTRTLGFKKTPAIDGAIDGSLILNIPGLTKLRLESRNLDDPGPRTVVRFSVDNGIKKLHELLADKITTQVKWQENWGSSYEAALKYMRPNSVSSLISGKKSPPVLGLKFYKFFVVDPDGNLLEYSYR